MRLSCSVCIPGEAANPAAATLRPPLVPRQPHRRARTSFSAGKPLLDSQAEAQNAWRHVKHCAGPTLQHDIVRPTDALPDRPLQQIVVDSNKQRPFLDKPMASKKPKHSTALAASRWSDFIPGGAADHVQHTSIAGNNYATCVAPEADEETGFITCLD